MSPRRNRAATAERSVVSTRSKAQKINNVNESVTKQTKQSQRKGKSSNVKNNLEAATKQSARKESPDAKIMFRTSVKKRTSRRRLNLDKGAEVEDTATAQENCSIDSNESVRILREYKRNDNISVTELIKNDLSRSSTPKDTDSDKMCSAKLQQKSSAVVNVSPIIVTPKSTPPKLSLTPHRSKKTPKKSPISLGSPKTHSLTVPKLLKSPRKLSLTTTSEEDSGKLDDSHSKKSRKTKKDNISISNKNLLTSPKNKHKKSDIHLKTIVRKFSKSPKIVLRSPKSKKSKSRKLKLLSPSRIRKSPLKISTPLSTTPDLDTTKSPKTGTKKSPLLKGKNLSAIKRRLLDSRLTKVMTASQIKDVLAEPIVLLEKLSPENVQKTASKTRSNTLIKKESPLISLRNSSKVLTPIATRISVESIMPANQSFNAKLRNSSPLLLERSSNRISPRLKNTSVQNKDRSSIPLMSSTPREEKTPLMVVNLTSNTPIVLADNTSFSTRARHRNQSNTQLSSVMDKSTIIENVSKSSLFDKDISNTSQSRLLNVRKRDVTHDKDSIMMPAKEKNKKDNTYELEQPQTLSLRQMIKKRTSMDANLSSERNVKRTRVRFVDVTPGRSSMHKSINMSTGPRSNVAHNISAQRRIINSAKNETPKFSRNTLVSSFKARSSPRTNGVTPRVQLSGMQVTPKTFMSIEKKSEKKSSVKRKVPNFGKIHEEMFARSESLVDAKKRLEARHLAFAANKDPKVDVKKEENKPLPTDTRDGTHNRFGFKLRKAEATRVMLKKQTVFSRQKKQNETRMMLQGVRTNRRFELQMKTRNLNA